MSQDAPESRRHRPVDPIALSRTRRRLEAAAEPPWLHAEVSRRMVERVPLVRQAPRRIIDWWAGAGGGVAPLAARLPEARLELLATEGAGSRAAGARWTWPRWLGGGPAAPARVAEPAADAYDMVWANMLLHHVADPQGLMLQWHAATAVDGFLMFSTLGTGTLASLRDAYRSLGWGSPMGALVDMHDLGDMLVEAGFADPVMDQELVRLTWRKADDALAELRSLGSNVDGQRFAGLRTPRWRAQLSDALSRWTSSSDGRVSLEFEVVYGHAFKPRPRFRVTPEARIDIDDLRRSLRPSNPR